MSTIGQPRFLPTPHPVLGLPSLADAQAMGAEAWRTMMARREEIIRRERSDPFLHGWEPPIWKVCDALLGFPWVDAAWASRLRERFGFPEPVDTLLCLGGNRASKSQWAGKRAMRIMRGADGMRCWAFHSTLDMSIEYQQPIFWSYIPDELRAKAIKSERTYIAYKEKTGFTEERFILPNGSRCTFKSYDQDNALEGGEVDVIWPDELVPREWVETLELRTATRAGKMFITFTPVEGYSDTVALFLDGAVVVKDCVGYVLPKDGGAPDVAAALGLAPAEYEEVLRAQKEKRAAMCPQSRPERCIEWVEEESRGQRTDGRGQGGEGGARLFERVPRVLRCVDKRRAVVFFHAGDNPFGNPKEVWSRIATRPVDFIKERFYGLAKKQAVAVFRAFTDEVHIVKPEAIPVQGTNYHLVDPHGTGRNFFMLWVRSTPEHDYVYREWPGGFFIPEIGVPGPWALPGTKTHPDGVKGPGQTSFGFSHWKYKEEIARLEKWPQVEEPKPAALSQGDWVKQWDQWRERPEYVVERAIDSRFASVPKELNDIPVTLLQEFDGIGLTFKPTPGDSVSEGVRDIENALHYNAQEAVSFFNKPRLLISSDCPNTIFALRIWTGMEKDRGATTEPIGLLRYFYRAGYSFVGGGDEEERDANVWTDRGFNRE